ncbi:MAG: hypothetical protein QGF25_05410 [Candidatus Woesearchaeota archaeon]|jgi:hypothetical protein|nr:hypothetical protein [Candidatus Woesearchaeota archaeon]MDP7467650.1 hypothetical protein [Candidatus Woesearchaeota archaeon]MDP7647132.1 hypothetical protein [Candidatus Woesearchaeota archaeon]
MSHSLSKIFQHHPDGVQLSGFKHADVLSKLELFLGREKSLEYARRRKHGEKSTVRLSFDPEFVHKRQKFFQRLYTSPTVRKTFFDKPLPASMGNLRRFAADKRFFGLCNTIENTLVTAKKELAGFRHLPEARRILSQIDLFNGEYEGMLTLLNSIQDMHRFAVDTDTGEIANLAKMPPASAVYIPEKGESSTPPWGKHAAQKIRVKMKKHALGLAKDVGIEFKHNILCFVRDQFRCKPGVRNLRADFEEIALPARLYCQYAGFLERCEKYNYELFAEIHGSLEMDDFVALKGFCPPDLPEREDLEAMAREFFLKDVGLMFEPVYPTFGNHFDIQGMFPPQGMGHWVPEVFVPINFKTKARERHYLLAGLHSGGKRFFLENLVLTCILANLGVSMPAESIKVPKFNRIFYYKSVDNYGRSGQCETEVDEINTIIDNAERGDLIVIDEFLKAAELEIAAALAPEVLADLRKSKATVIITSHRTTDYQTLEDDGWKLMTPAYENRSGKIEPAWKLQWGPPDPGVNKQYIMGKYRASRKGR